MSRGEQDKVEASQALCVDQAETTPLIRPVPSHHRDSDASDASNSHLMVYDDSQERKSSISFDKIRQISLTYSLQSEDEPSMVGFSLANSNAEQFPETNTNAIQVTDRSQEQNQDTPSDSMRALEEQLRIVKQRIEMTAPAPNEPRNPFVESELANSGASGDFLLRGQEIYYAGANQQQQQQRQRARDFERDQNNNAAGGNQDNSSTVSLKLSRNMSANIIINNEAPPSSRRGSQLEPKAAQNCNTSDNNNNNYSDRYAGLVECASGGEYLEQSNSDNSSSCWDWRSTAAIGVGSSTTAAPVDCSSLAPRSRASSGRLKTDYNPKQTNGHHRLVVAAPGAAKQETLIERADEWMQSTAERQHVHHHQRDSNSRPTSACSANQVGRSRATLGAGREPTSIAADAIGPSDTGWRRSSSSPVSDQQRGALQVDSDDIGPLDRAPTTTKRLTTTATNGGHQHDGWPDNEAALECSSERQATRGRQFAARTTRAAANHLASASPTLRGSPVNERLFEQQQQQQYLTYKRSVPMMAQPNLSAIEEHQARAVNQTNSSEQRPSGHFANAQFASQRYIEQQRRARRQMLEAQQCQCERANLPNFFDVTRPAARAVPTALRGRVIDRRALSPFGQQQQSAAYRVDMGPDQPMTRANQIAARRQRHHHFSATNLASASASVSLQNSPRKPQRHVYTDIQLASNSRVPADTPRPTTARRAQSNSWQQLDRFDFDDYDETELAYADDDDFAMTHDWPLAARSNNRPFNCCARASTPMRWPYGREPMYGAASQAGQPVRGEPDMELEFQLEDERDELDDEDSDELEPDGYEEPDEADDFGNSQWFYSSENKPPLGPPRKSRQRPIQPQTTRAQTRRKQTAASRHQHHQQASREERDTRMAEAKMMMADSAPSISSSGGEPAEALVFYNGRRWERRPTGPFVAAGGQSGQQRVHGHSRAAAAANDDGANSITTAPTPPLPPSVVIDSNVNNLNPSTGAATANKTSGEPSRQPDTSTPTVTPTPAQPTGQPVKQQQQQLKPVDIRNLLNDETTTDRLHIEYQNNNKSHGCNEKRCLGSMINPKPVAQRVRSGAETWEQAKEFIDGYYKSIKRFDTPAHKNRLVEIEEQIKSTDTYYLRETELIYGAKLAWRNAPRCIGRIQWSKLQVFDARFSRNANEMFEAICNHIKYATNKGMLRSAATIFPQRVKSVNNDWRIWNAQLISYAGYRNEETGEVIGDPINAEFTQICHKLGWKGPKGGEPGMFDILPIVLSANGGPPQLFELPDDLVMRVKIKHPKFDWFQQLGLEWYALPAVSSMMLDVGGLQFTACPFSGWYMVTEIGTRDLGDVSRYNMLEKIAQGMGLNTETNASLWRDQAVTQLNLAVLDSFQSANVTIVDHHTASETFMTHLQNEQRLRGGCPADWVWLVPPTAGSTTQVFHQEMINYHLLPNYEYLPPAWKNYDWSAWERIKELEEQKKLKSVDGEQVAGVANGVSPTKNGATQVASSLLSSLKSVAALQTTGTVRSPLAKLNLNASPLSANGDLTPRHLRFKEIARAVKFTSKLFGKALSRRIKATILYATETGKSERFANKLAQIFSHAFNVHLMSMSDYDMTCLEHEALLLIVTSTFGNGDPPENGELFAKHLAAIKMTGDSSPDIDSINSVATNPFFQMLSEDHKDGLNQAANAAAAAAAAAEGNSSSSGCGTSDFDSPTREQLDSGDDSSTDQPIGESETNKRSWLSNSREHLATNGTVGGTPDGQRRPVGATQNFLNQEQQTNIKPLSNVRFAVFALGSTAYPHFCAFGRYVDQTLGELGAERILKCQCGDELCGQEKAFNEWSKQVFEVACEVFCQTDQMQPIDDRTEPVWTPDDVKFVYLDDDNNNTSLTSKSTIIQNLVGIVGKKILPFSVKRRRNLHEFTPEENLQTICVDLDGGNLRPIKFEAGDHISIYPVNKLEVVDKIIARIEHDLATLKRNNGELETNGITAVADDNSKLSSPKKRSKSHQLDLHMDKRVSIQVKRGNMDPLTQTDEWIQCDTLPITSIREALTRYLDITNAPNQDFLSILARQASDADERKRLQQMARNFTIYEEWKNKQVPSLLSVLEEFKSVKFHPALITQIPPMKPRFYSISSTLMSLTLGVVRYTTQMGELREGLCSNYLNSVPVDPKSYVYGYVRSAPAFHMPHDKTVPMLLISAGTGIAPFRAFWLQRYADMFTTTDQNGTKPVDRSTFGRIEMYFGCRNSKYILYKDELDEMQEIGVLSGINIAFSRPRDCDVFEEDENKNNISSANGFATDRPFKSKIDSIRQVRKKMYVQDKLFERGEDVFKLIMYEGAHIYVCGDVAMADGVYKSLTKILNQQIKAGRQALKTIKSNGSICNLSPEAGKVNCQDLVRNGEDGESILMNLRNLNRYHEDIFGAKQA